MAALTSGVCVAVAASSVATVASVGSMACDRDRGRDASRVAAPASSDAAAASMGGGVRPSVAPESASGAAAPKAASAAAPPVGSAPTLRAGAIALDAKPVDLATGALVALGAVGAVIRRRDDEILMVRLGEKVTPLADDGKTFARRHTLIVDRGQGAAAYWANEGRLLRRLIDAEGKLSPVEVLATDVEEGYAPHGVRDEGGATATAQDVVAYVARRRSADGDRRARLWVEGKGVRDLAPEGSGASSVALVSVAPGRLAGVWLDGRSALAPVHAAPIELDGAGEPRVGAETTVWIAPPSELLTSVAAMRADGGLVALFATPKNGVDFGLAGAPIVFGAAPLDAPVWFDFANGLDPAPVVPARFCGLSAAVIVRPTARAIDAPRVVEIATVEASGRVTPRLEVARAGRVDHVAAWASPRGEGWVAWVGDGRTKARRVRCGK